MTMENPYRARGTLIERSYIKRDADTELQVAIKDNDRYPFVLAPRQSGKSSVMERVRSLLATEDLRIIIIDLSLFSQKDMVDFDQFILNFLTLIYEKLDVTEKLGSHLQNLKYGPTFLLKSIKLLLQTLSGRIIICLDELDALITSEFKDDFLSQIRALFNERASDPFFKRIQFILAAAVSQDSLISDPNRSPFNVGAQIVLRDFNKEQVDRLVAVGNWLDVEDIEKASDRISYWTNGSVFLSQSILEKAYLRRYGMTDTWGIRELIDNIVMEIITSAPREIHFRNIGTQLREQPLLLSAWENWMDGAVPDMKVRESLLLAGISDEKNPIRNRIYQGVFSVGGTLCLMPKANRLFYDVFLSYSYKDKETVYALAERLKKDGVSVWLDIWAIQPGDSISSKINQGLKQSRRLLICMSQAYFDSMWGGLEYQTLLFHDPINVQGHFIPLLIENCILPDAIAQFAYIDWRTSSDEAYKQLLVACREDKSVIETDIPLSSDIYVSFVQKVGDSKFEFRNMVRESAKGIFVIGPNLAFLSRKENREQMREFLFNKFHTNPKFEIKMLIMDPRNENIQKINLGFTDQFLDELKESVTVFAGWARDAKESNFKLNVRVTELLTLSLLFRDMATHESCVLVTPIPYRSKGADRPCFLIKKKNHRQAFKAYFKAYFKLFNSKEYSTDIEDVWAQMKDLKNPDIRK